MKTNKDKKIVYVISSTCAVFILGVGIFVADIKIIELDQLPEEFMFIENLLIPGSYEFKNSFFRT